MGPVLPIAPAFGQRAVRHLHALGHRRVAFISGPMDHPDAMQRLEGYRSELRHRSMDVDDALVITSDYQETGGFRSMNALLEKQVQFTAVLAAPHSNCRPGLTRGTA